MIKCKRRFMHGKRRKRTPFQLSTQKDKPKTMTQKDFKERNVVGFMRPPYKEQRDLAGNIRYYHGYKWKNQKTEKNKKKN